MKKFITLLLLACTFNSYSQDWPVKKQVQDKKKQGTAFINLSAFRFTGNKILPGTGTCQLLHLDNSFINQLYQQKPAALQLTIPLSNSRNIVVELVKYSVGNVIFKTNNSSVVENIEPPLTYRGIVAGEESRNSVWLTVNREYLSFTAITGKRTIQVTKAGEEQANSYRLYNSEKISFPKANFDCGTDDNEVSELFRGMEQSGSINRPAAAGDKCVNVFVDCSDSLYMLQSSSVQRTVNFVYEIFNGVVAGYYNESINLQITTINVWSTPDPYSGTTRELLLRSMADYYRDNFWGNICVGLDFTSLPKGGLADAIGKVKGVAVNTCPAYTATESAICYNDLADGAIAQNFPTGPNTNNSQIYLVMHEIGHLIGSRHTKWCGWKLTENPDTYGRIDTCGEEETFNGSGCGPGAIPNNGGTIMSYCFRGTSFINYNNGFGPLPGAVIRNFVDQNACIVNCTECFGTLRRYNSEEYAIFQSNDRKNESNGNGSPFRGRPTVYNNNYFISQKTRR